MYYNVLELKDVIENESAKFEKKVLMENGDSALVAIA